MSDFQHLIVSNDSDKQLRITLPAHNETPSITAAITKELSAILSNATKNANLQGIIIETAPADTTCPQIAQDALNSNNATTALQQAVVTIELSQQAGQQLLDLNIPSVFLLRRTPSIYELSLALAANYCISSDQSDVHLAFNETRFGLHPNIISTQQTVLRMGITEAMGYLLTSATLSPQLAAAKGLLDACVPPTALNATALDFLNRKPVAKQAGFTQRLRAMSVLRKALKSDLRQQLLQLGTESQYPAPYALLNLWEQYGLNNTDSTQAAYSESIQWLSHGSQSVNLSRIVNLKQQLLHQSSAISKSTIKHIHVIGFSAAAQNIASCLVTNNVNVTFHLSKLNQQETVEQLTQKIRHRLAKQFNADDNRLETTMSKLLHDSSGNEVSKADLILLVDELNLADSQELFAELEEKAKPDAILAIHSVVLPLDKIAAALLNPQRLVGIHFCQNMVETELVEVSYGDKTDNKLLSNIRQFISQLDKVSLLMRNNPGQLVSRVLLHYVVQGIRLHQQGVPHAYVDRAGRQSGMPAGPLELADRLGLDYCIHLAEALQKARNNIEIPYSLSDMVKAGKLGIKSGSGFYRYRNGNRLKQERIRWNGSEQALQEKLAGQIYEESAICLEEGLLESPELVDVGIVIGTSFAPYLGGPLYQRHNHTGNN